VAQVNAELLAEAWYNPTATGSSDNDEGPLPLVDGSLHLSYDPNTRQVRTWNEREGVRVSTREDPNAQYFTAYTEEKVLVPPFDKFASLEVVFKIVPAETAVYATLVSELKRAVQGQPKRLSTTAYAKTGPKSDKAAQRQVRGRNGKYIVIEFDPKDGTISTFDGKVLGSVH